MNYTYLLTGTKGAWDSHHSFTIGIFTSHELAAAEKIKFIEEATLLSKKYTKKEIEKYNKELIDALFSSNENLPIYLKEYSEWPAEFRHGTFEGYNFNEFTIQEIPLNTRVIIIGESY